MFYTTSALDYQTAAGLDIKTKISKVTQLGKPEQDFLFASLNAWLASDKRKLMIKGQEYFENKGDINDKIRTFIDRLGMKKETTLLTNTKLAHPYMKKLVNQKANRLLSKPFSVSCADDVFEGLLTSNYFKSSFMRMIKNICKEAVTKGLAWVQVYYDEKGELKFKRIPAEEIVPFWKDADHTELEAVIRNYAVTHYLPDGTVRLVEKIEYHTLSGVWYFIKGPRGLEVDKDSGELAKGHFTIASPKKDKEGNIVKDNEGNDILEENQATWERLPFIAFKYNPEEISLLQFVKTLIDEYDNKTSMAGDTIGDIPDSIKVVKNYDGTDKEEFTHNLNTFRTIFVAENGDVTNLDTKLDMTAIDSHLNRLRKDIYDGGNGVDMQEETLGAASGVALKFRFADLDSDVDDIATEFTAALEQLTWFIRMDMLNKGLGDFTEEDEVSFVFNTDTIVDETEVIANARSSAGVISEKTILNNHPWVKDVALELEQLEEERQKQLEETADDMELQASFATGGPSEE